MQILKQMLSKSQIKFISSLKQKKFRAEHHLFIAEGSKIVHELLKSSIGIKQVYATADFIGKTTFPNTVECMQVSVNEMERISALTTPSEVLAVCAIPGYQLDTNALKNKLTLVLDDIRDPGNLGTIIRIADWFGITDIICSNDTADAYNPKVIQATMGSISRVKVYYSDLPELFRISIPVSTGTKVRVFGALLEGENIYTQKLSSEGFIVIGNESKGISEKVLPYITDKINIPSFSAKTESLNAAIATAIICSEFRRR